MKKFLLITFLMLLSCIIQAAPFLVCDPYPTTAPQPVSFIVTMDAAAPVTSPAFKNPDGSMILHYDLTSVSVGSHNVTVKAVDSWGATTTPTPFSFVRPAALANPANINISGQ